MNKQTISIIHSDSHIDKSDCTIARFVLGGSKPQSDTYLIQSGYFLWIVTTNDDQRFQKDIRSLRGNSHERTARESFCYADKDRRYIYRSVASKET